jgi:hypothetical protein
MKKVIFIALLLVGSFMSIGQTLIYDTLNGNEVVNFETVSVTGAYSTVTFDILCTELGGTSDGTLVLQARNGSSGNWSTITNASFSKTVEFLSDSIFTITDGGVWKVQVTDPGFTQYRIQGDGTASDTTLIQIYYAFKKR